MELGIFLVIAVAGYSIGILIYKSHEYKKTAYYKITKNPLSVIRRDLGKYDLYGDLAGILTVAASKSLKAEQIETMADQIREMSGVSAALNPELNEMAGNPSISGDSSYSGKMVAGAGNQLEEPSFDPILAKMVAGARFELTTFRL